MTTATKIKRDADAICDEIAERLGFVMEDQGIGAYEFHGAKGFDSRKVPVCMTDVVEIDVTEAESIPCCMDLEGSEAECEDGEWTLNPGEVVVQLDRVTNIDGKLIALYRVV